jgi:nucleoid DNA-binding protein
MGMEQYLNELLYRYNCVVIPDFGAFLTQRKSAYVHRATHTFYPPRKLVSFNEQLRSNDGLLISYMAEAEQSGYETMLDKVDLTVREWKQKLKNGERISFLNIGELWVNKEGKIQFQPSEQINFLTASYGLSSFVASPVTREVLKEQVVDLEAEVPLVFTPEQRQINHLRPYLKYAAVFLLALSVGLTGYRTYQQGVYNRHLAVEEAEQQVSRRIQEATFFDASPIELSALSLGTRPESPEPETVFAKIEKKAQKTHYIIAGAFQFKKNAEKKIKQLKKKGFDAAYIGTNDFGLYMVAYDSFTDAAEALRVLREIKQTESRDAWLKSVK